MLRGHDGRIVTRSRTRIWLSLGAALGLAGAFMLGERAPSAARIVTAPDGIRTADDSLQAPAASRLDLLQETRLQGAGFAPRALDPPEIVLRSDEDLVRVRVLDDQGRPVPGADVHWIGSPSADPLVNDSFLRDTIVHTNAEGRAVLRINRFEPRRVEVHARGHAPVTVEKSLLWPTLDDLLVVLGEGLAIQGRVVADEDGRPHSGARVYRIDPQDEVPLADATTGPDGRFRLRASAVASGSSYFEVHDLERPRVTVKVPVTADGKSIELRVGLGRSFEGIVRTGDGAPVSDAIVQFRPWPRTRALGGPSQRTQTNRVGRFHLRVPISFEDPLWVITVHGSDGGWNFTTPLHLHGLEHDLTLCGFGSIEGHVLTSGGAPVAGVRVRCEYVMDPPEWLNPTGPTEVPPTDLAPTVVTSADGSFRFPRLLGIPVRIWAEAADGRKSEPVSTQTYASTATVLEPIVLPSGE